IAHGLFGTAMIPFGVAHFLYMNATAPLVPHWLPGSGVFWGYLTGATFVAAGLAILLNVTARLATALVAAQMALLTLIIWVPPVARGPNPGQWQEFVTSWVLSACGWIVAESFRPGP
ncbi:MAG TPA: hypothetical protein VG916_00230, partial [Gemmatimonadaceae bacterium]|nr:hypothetical protein [Gemmatimonadaceae bacterium]